MNRPARSLATAVPASASCMVCEDARWVELRIPGGGGVGRIRCPHCSRGIGTPVPIHIHRMRNDVPGEQA